MKSFLFKSGWILGTAVVLTGCIDKNYDLSDIDTTTKVNINDLVIPMNLDKITLDNIIKIDDDSKIKIVTLDGEKIYAITQSGDITSDPIEVDGFTAAPPAVTDASMTFDLTPTRAAVANSYTFRDADPQSVNFRAENVDQAIQSVKNISMDPMDIKILISTTGLDANTTMKFPYINLDFIKGLVLEPLPANYNYDAATGELKITNAVCTGHDYTIALRATGVDFSKTSGTELKDHAIDFRSTIMVKDAELLTETNIQNPADAPSLVTFTIHTEVDGIKATAFSGEIDYKLEGDGLNIEPVDLTDIPDFLAGDETNIILVNPQIYMNIDNPMARDGVDVKLSTGLTMTAVRPDGNKPYPLNTGQLVTVGYDRGAGPYNFVLSPDMPTAPLDEYNNHLQHVGYSSLSYVLSGDGLPTKVDITLENPGIPAQEVENFKLYTNYNGVVGKYDFFAPLSLEGGLIGGANSVIVYRKDDTGWSDETLEKTTIEQLNLTLKATSSVPLTARLNVYPLDINGQVMPCERTTAVIDANAEDQEVTLTLKGEIKNLDGVRFEATVYPTREHETLSPEQTIDIKNLKAKVTGYYLSDF